MTIYRAKKINSNKYGEGYLVTDIKGNYFILDIKNIHYETFTTSDGTYHGITCNTSYEIDPSTLEEAITNIKSSNYEFIEWLKLEAKKAPTWSEHSAYMKVLRYFEGIENDDIR